MCRNNFRTIETYSKTPSCRAPNPPLGGTLTTCKFQRSRADICQEDHCPEPVEASDFKCMPAAPRRRKTKLQRMPNITLGNEGMNASTISCSHKKGRHCFLACAVEATSAKNGEAGQHDARRAPSNARRRQSIVKALLASFASELSPKSELRGGVNASTRAESADRPQCRRPRPPGRPAPPTDCLQRARRMNRCLFKFRLASGGPRAAVLTQMLAQRPRSEAASYTGA